MSRRALARTACDIKGSQRGRRSFGTVLVLATLAALASACSSPSASRSIASLPSSGGSTTTTTPTLTKAQQIAQDDQANVDFARCMRTHGVNVPDPVHVVGHPGLSFEVPARTASNAAAFDACSHFLQSSGEGKGGPGGPAISAAQLAALTSYARCMRTHDISMPDPDQYGDLNLGNVPGMNHDFGRYSPQFRSADSACRHLLPAGTHDIGNGP